MSTDKSKIIRNLSLNANVPIVLRDFISDWSIGRWNIEKWCSVFGDREIPFRCLEKDFISDEPCWERRCKIKKMTFKGFVDSIESSPEWMYFDYKYLHQWFSADTNIFKEICWKEFGYPEKGAAESTLWVGSSGAHTPAHRDTYGVNIVAQLFGKKRWILFPPETGGLKPTRVPYEESSVYSELNFYCPNDLDAFNGLTGGRVVELCSGDALLVPQGWWHYVQNMDPLNIALNIWIPHEKDSSARVSEALIKILVAQICKDLPQETAKMLVNPNEDDISETPLAVLFLQLETVTDVYLDNRRKARRAKRQKTREDGPSTALPDDIESLQTNSSINLEIPPLVSSEQLISILKENIKKYANPERSPKDEELYSDTASLNLTKAVIDAFSQSNVIDLVKQNLFTRLS